MVDCRICGQTGFKHAGSLGGHIRWKHGVSMKDYNAGQYSPQPQNPPPPIQSASNPNPPPQLSTVQGLSEANLQNIADRLYTRLQGNDGRNLPRGVTPMRGLEEVEVIGEKINYKVALNPDVFWRWNVFKGQNMRLASMGQAELFQGDFSDFIDLSTKTLLSTYGMYPTVMTFTGGKMLVEMPVTRDEE